MDITIVIPVLNRKALLKHTLDSILRSPWADAPVIVVDNGSTDGTPEFLEEYCASHPNISMAHEPVRSAAAARNCGLSLVKTQWVYFFDSDDEFEDIPHSWNTDADMVAFPTRQSIQGKVTVRAYTESSDPAVHILNGMLNTISMIFRTSWLKEIGGWNTRCRIWDDWELGARALIAKPNLQWILTQAYHTAIIHGDSLTGSSVKSRYILQLEKIKEILSDLEHTDVSVRTKCRKALMLRTYIISGQLLHEGQREASAQCRSFIDKEFGNRPDGTGLGKILEKYTALGLRGAWRIALRKIMRMK